LDGEASASSSIAGFSNQVHEVSRIAKMARNNEMNGGDNAAEKTILLDEKVSPSLSKVRHLDQPRELLETAKRTKNRGIGDKDNKADISAQFYSKQKQSHGMTTPASHWSPFGPSNLSTKLALSSSDSTWVLRPTDTVTPPGRWIPPHKQGTGAAGTVQSSPSWAKDKASLSEKNAGTNKEAWKAKSQTEGTSKSQYNKYVASCGKKGANPKHIRF